VTDHLNALDEEQYLVSLLLPVTTRTLRDSALDMIDPDDFGSGQFGGLWAAARLLRSRDKPINRRTLLAAAHEVSGGHAAEMILDRLDGSVPMPADFPHAVDVVKRYGQLRRLLVVAERIKQRVLSAEDFGGAYGAALDELNKLAEDDEGDDFVSIGEVVAGLEQRFKTGNTASVIPTPWAELNDKTAGGLHRGRLIVIGARPGDGKSIGAHQIAAFAAEHGHPAVIFSLEMSNAEVGGRVLASGGKIDMGEIARSRLDSDDSWRRYHEFRERAQAMQLRVCDRPGLTIDYIKSACRSQKRRAGLDVIAVDYLQLLGLRGIQSREQQVSEIAREFKNLARELDCVVVLPSQLNRDTVRRGRPSIADLRESGGIESHADLVVLLARQHFPDGHEFAGQPNGMVALDIAKNRFGPTAAIELPWRGCYASIG
jgi:replicative DNA helicase